MAEFARQYMLSGPDDCAEISTSVASRIETGALKFADFIASGQEYAVDDDLTIRAKSIEYIASVLALFKPDTLPRIEISVLVAFLQTRIDDNAGVKEASQGLRSLMGMTRFIKKDAVDVLETVFKNIPDLQRQPVLARFAIYRLIERALERCREVLEGMGPKFIAELVSLVEFEKDPRNLMVVFSILHVVMSEFPVEESQIVALWDAVFRYYPITYNPKPEDNVQITRSDLQHRLEACIASNSRFAVFAFPSLLAKLDQVSATVRVETLATTSVCILSYSASSIEPHVPRLWDLIKHEAYGTMDHTAALRSAILLRNLVHKIFDEPGHEDIKRDLVNLAASDILGNISTMTDENVRKSDILVTAVASGSPIAFSLVLESIMPSLLTIYQDLDGRISETASTLKLFGNILGNANFHAPSPFYTPPTGSLSSLGIAVIRSERLKPIETLGAFRDQLLGLYDAALRHQEMIIQRAALQGLVKLAKVPELLSYDEAGMIVQSLTAIVLDRADEVELRGEAIKGLQLLSSIPQEDIRVDHVSERSNQMAEAARDGAEMIKSITFPALLEVISLSSNVNVGDTARQEPYSGYAKINRVYSALTRVSSEVKIFEAFLKATQTQLEQVLHSADYRMAKVILRSIHYGLERHIDHFKRSSGNLKFPLNGSPIQYQETVKKLISLVVEFDENRSTISIRQYSGVEIEDIIIDVVGQIALLVFRSVQCTQKLAANELLTLFVESSDGSTKKELRNKIQSWYNTDNASPQARRTIILTKYILASMRPTQDILAAYDLEKLAAHVIQAIKLHGGADSNVVTYSFSETLGLLVNKFCPYIGFGTGKIEKAIADLLASCFIEDNHLTLRQTVPIVMLAFQYTTAMVTRGEGSIYSSTNRVPLLDRLVLLLSGPGGQIVANGFGTLLAKSATLNKQNHAVILKNHKQQLYGHFFPKVLGLFESLRDKPEAQKNILVAITNVITHISGERWLLGQSPVTILLRTLDLRVFQPRPKRAALELMIATAKHHPETLIPHAKSVINRLLTCASDEDAEVRALAVACCKQLPDSWKDNVALPYKQRVVRALDLALGDVDARVRSEAVDCRMKWFNIVEPEDE